MSEWSSPSQSQSFPEPLQRAVLLVTGNDHAAHDDSSERAVSIEPTVEIRTDCTQYDTLTEALHNLTDM